MYHLIADLPELISSYYIIGAVAFCFAVDRLISAL